jgi:type II secretion system protein H
LARTGAAAAVRRCRAFTLIELIFVLALLAIAAAAVAPSMSSFFRGRALNFEARRMLSLTHYAQSVAVSEGVPVLLWVDVKDSTYGVSVQSAANAALDEDSRARTYTADPNLTLETPVGDLAATSETEDEKLGLPEGLPAIRFTPDGFYDDSSVRRIVIRDGTDAALELVQTSNRLGYEIRPATPLN